LCGFVRNRGKFPQITVIFALRGVVGSRGRNTAAELAEATPDKPGYQQKPTQRKKCEPPQRSLPP